MSDWEIKKRPLTKREKEVASLLVNGKTSQEAADELFVSKRTVDFHVANLYEKLGVSNRAQLVRQAMKLGLAG